MAYQDHTTYGPYCLYDLRPLLSPRTQSARPAGSPPSLLQSIQMRPSSVSIPPLEPEQPHISPNPSSLIPPNPRSISWAGDDETDRSYDPSQLQPSPSIMSVSTIPEGPDATSFLRSSGSIVSSVNKLSTLPVSASMLTTRTSSHRLVASPALQLSSSSSSVTPSMETMSSFSSSFSDGLSLPSQPFLSPSSIVTLPLPEGPGIDEESVEERAPRTISTLLDTARASASRSPTPIPIPPRTYTVMPEGTIIMSVSTPYSYGGIEQASLRTVSEKPLPPTPRDFALELDRLAEDLRGYNYSRRQENHEIVDDVKTLRDELQGLSEYSRSNRPPNVVRIIERPIDLRPRLMESRSVGGSTEITALHHSSPEEVLESVGVALTRASSTTSSVESFLSSHHSDDSSLYEYTPSLVLPISDTESESEDESSFASSSELTESEVMPVTPAQITPPMPVSLPEIMPTPPARSSSRPTRTAPSAPLDSVDWMAPFNAIMDQLDDLSKQQAETVRKMNSLHAPEYPEIPAMHHTINRVEDLVRGLIETFESRPPQPVMIPVPVHQPTLVPPESRPPSQAATIHDQLPYSTPAA